MKVKKIQTKVLFSLGSYGDKYVLDVEDGQMLIGILARARPVKSDYVNGVGYVHTYKPQTTAQEFTIVHNHQIKYPDDLKELVLVKRDEGEVIPDDGKNTEASSGVPF